MVHGRVVVFEVWVVIVHGFLEQVLLLAQLLECLDRDPVCPVVVIIIALGLLVLLFGLGNYLASLHYLPRLRALLKHEGRSRSRFGRKQCCAGPRLKGYRCPSSTEKTRPIARRRYHHLHSFD